MNQVTVFSGPERPLRWSEEERLRVLAEAFSPGACVAETCRRHDILTSLVYTWRSKLRQAHAEAEASETVVPAFAEAVVVDEDAGSCAGTAPAMVIDLARGKRVGSSSRQAASPMRCASSSSWPMWQPQPGAGAPTSTQA